MWMTVRQKQDFEYCITVLFLYSLYLASYVVSLTKYKKGAMVEKACTTTTTALL